MEVADKVSRFAPRNAGMSNAGMSKPQARSTLRIEHSAFRQSWLSTLPHCRIPALVDSVH
jgi:hypothetical protein